MNSELSYKVLLDKYKKTEKELGDAEKTLRRITGRDPQELSKGGPGSGKFRQGTAPGRYTGRKRPLYIVRKHSKDSSYEEDSGADDDEELSPKKPTLQSTVVDKSRQGRSRKATIEEQNANSKIKARNRRMFGALIGTLEKFQHEEKERQHKESMRAEIEQKVEAATEEERERIKKEKETLFLTRREKQSELRCLEKKLERAESFEVYERNHHKMKNFMQTKAKPHIFFLPSSHTSETKKHHQETKIKIQDVVKTRKELLENELKEIEAWYTKDHALPANKENKCPKDEVETQDVPESESESLVVEQEDTNLDDDDDSNNTKNIELPLTDQDFEPIYD